MSDLNSRSVIKTLQRAGFRVLRNRDHVRLSDGMHFVSVPHQTHDLRLRTFRLILKQAGMSVEQFERWRRQR